MTSLASLDVAGKRVFLRCDLNVPLKNGVITDDGRIRASLPTITNLLERGATLVIGAHLGRPKGEIKAELSLAPVAKKLAELLGQEVDFVTHNSAKIVLLENLRFHSAETSKVDAERKEFAKELAAHADVYVGDGFGAVHRRHVLQRVEVLAPVVGHAARMREVVFVHLFDVRGVAAKQVGIAFVRSVHRRWLRRIAHDTLTSVPLQGTLAG